MSAIAWLCGTALPGFLLAMSLADRFAAHDASSPQVGLLVIVVLGGGSLLAAVCTPAVSRARRMPDSAAKTLAVAGAILALLAAALIIGELVVLTALPPIEGAWIGLWLASLAPAVWLIIATLN